jgi:asparagine synthase (glutamine-hydrolysing)
VIDLATGDQPMWDDGGRYVIVFNGEIYNYRELRRELAARGVRFRTQSDTEVLLLAYREYGEQVAEHLNGQYAFAIWDRQTRRLFAARDRLGEKPLFYAHDPAGRLLLASEIRGVLAAETVDPALDPDAVDLYLTLIYVPPDRTVYRHVRPLPPGHALVWQHGRLRQWAYWSPRRSVCPVDPVEAVRHTRELIERAVRRQMVADVPVGAFLSGGMDSTTIVTFMTRAATAPVLTFAAGFGDLIDELPYAREVAAACATDHREMQMALPVGELLERMADVYDEPFGDSSNIPTYLISELAHRHVKVVLSGDGGDELFGGYDWYRPLLEHDRTPTDAMRLLLWRSTAQTMNLLAGLGLPLRSQHQRSRQRARSIRDKRRHPDVWRRHVAALAVQSRQGRAALWRNAAPDPGDVLLRAYEPDGAIQGIDRAVDFDLRCYLPGDILVKVDRAAMAHGLETRCPFLDVELVEFVLSLPAETRFKDGTLKHLLRASCADLWPPSIRDRGKQGFGAPIGAWLRRPDVRGLMNRVCTPGSPLTELLPGLPAQRSRVERHAQAAWNLLCLGLWLEKRPACLNRLSSVA